MSIDIDRLVEMVRYDVDYHNTEPRSTTAQQGSINRELNYRIKKAEKKDQPIYYPGMRLRILNDLGVRATFENHQLFDKAVEIFEERLALHNDNANEDYSGTDIVING